jgi:hypothetical protein
VGGMAEDSADDRRRRELTSRAARNSHCTGPGRIKPWFATRRQSSHCPAAAVKSRLTAGGELGTKRASLRSARGGIDVLPRRTGTSVDGRPAGRTQRPLLHNTESQLAAHDKIACCCRLYAPIV